MSSDHPLNQLPGDPYRGVDSSPPELSQDEMMSRMRARVQFDLIYKRWEAEIFWMERSGARVLLTTHGKECSEAVRNLYHHFTRMLSEGWTRTS